MAVKKGILDNFLKPSSHYTDNQKYFRSIFIDKSEDDLRPDRKNFFEAPVESREETVDCLSSSAITNSDDIGITRKQGTEKINTNQTQTQHKVDTNSTQSEHKKIIVNVFQTQSRHKVDTKLNTHKTQSRHKVDTNLTQSRHISTLIGIQRMILLFIFEECKKARSYVTEPLSIIYIASSLEIAQGSIKTSIARLCKKEFLKVFSFKNGRGGWCIYEIPDNVYKELFQIETQHKLNTNRTQTEHKVDTKPNTQLNTKTSCSSSFKDLKITTTEIGEEWNFDITPYSRFGFTKTQVKQLATSGTIAAADVEQSLIEFSHDIDNNALPSIKTTKINFLMGLLWKGRTYVSEGYKNQQEAMISEIARRAEVKRKKLIEEKFVAWEASLDDNDRKIILSKLPTSLMVLEKTYGISNERIKSWYFDYFIQNETG